jgi:hypothetical protein
MSNVKISSKGKALLSKGYSSAKVVDAIVRGGGKLYSKEGLNITVGGKQLRVRAASSNSQKK